MNAYDCSRFNFNRKSDTGYGFGTDPANIAKELRALADQIDSGIILIQRVTTVQRAKVEDYASTRILLDVVEARKRTITSDELAELTQETKP